MGYFNVLSGYRMAVEFNGKLYFAGMGNPTATLVEVDPETNTAKIAYAERVANMTPPAGHEKEKMSNGVHGLVEYDGQLLMCLASADYDRDGKYSPGGIIVASSDPTQGLANWKVIANQANFDFLPGVLQTDGLNGGGIWDIIEYNGYLYVTIVTDKTDLDTGIIHKQGFAMYRGEKLADGSFTWTQVIGGNDEAKMPFGLGIDHSMSCNLWTYVAEDGKEYLYLGTYNDPMLDLNAAFAQSNYELLYNDLDHSIYLYRMNENEEFEMVGGKDDNPMFPDGPIGNLGVGLGNNSNQYVWRYGEHQDELMIGTYDTATLTYIFTQVTDGQIETVTIEELEARSNAAIHAILTILGQAEDSPWREILDEYVFNNQLHKLYTAISKALSAITKDQNPVPSYREALAKFDELRALVDELDDWYNGLSKWDRFLIEKAIKALTGKDLATWIKEIKALLLEQIDKLQAEFEKLGSIVYYFGVNYYAQQAERGFDLLISNDGVNFDAITRDGLGSKNNHGLRTIESTDVGVFFGTANPFQGTQLWLMHSGRDAVKSYVILDANVGVYADDTTTKRLPGEVGTTVENYEKPTRDGYTFLGWAETPDADAVLDDVVFGEKGTTTTYYAVWEKNPVVVLDANDGKYTDGSDTLTLTGKAGKTVNTAEDYAEPTRDGFTFLGWASTPDATTALGTVVFGEAETTTTFYAVWEQNIVPDPTSDVLLNANGGAYTDGTAVLTLTGKVGAAVDSVKDYEKPTRDGYTFLGWAADSDADAVLDDVVFGEKGTTTTYYAVWEKNPVVVLDANDGKYTDGSDTLTLTGKAGKTVNTAEDYAEPTRDGFTFLGWASTPDATTALGTVVFGEAETTTTFYAVWEQNIVPDPTSDVLLNANGGAYTDGTAVLTLTGKVGAAVDSVKDYEKPTRDGYTFLGWAADSDADTALRTVEFGAEDTRTTYYAVWQYNKPEDDNGDKDPTGTLDFIGAMAYYRNRKNTVTFVADDCGGKVVSSTGAEKDTLTYTILDGARIKYVPSVVVAADYAFQHWYCPETEKTYTSNEIINMAVTADLTFQAVSLPTNVPPAVPSTDTTGTVIDAVESPKLNTTDDYAYLTVGSDGNVNPDEQITRGEVATLLFRLLTEESRETFWCKRNDFSDVPGTHALNTAISTIANAGIINGYPDGTFRPDNTITRAEFASILSKFVEVTGEEVSFSDVSGHWAESVIADIAAAGWINGYEDGTFRPDGLITRAEAVKILNAAANRTFNGNAVALNDVSEDAWYYKEIEAAVSGKSIQWELLENPLNLFYFAVIK